MMPLLLADVEEFAHRGRTYGTEWVGVGSTYKPIVQVGVEREPVSLPSAWKDELYYARGHQPVLTLHNIIFRKDVRGHGHCKALIAGAKLIGARLGYTALRISCVTNKRLVAALRRWGGWTETKNRRGRSSFWWALDLTKAGVRMTYAEATADR